MKTIKVVPTITTGVAYVANDQIGGVQDLTEAERVSRLLPSGAIRKIGRGAEMLGISIVDKASQSPGFHSLFFNDLPAVAGDANPMSITDAEMDDKYIGKAYVDPTEWIALATNSIIAVENGLYLASKRDPSKFLYAVVMVTNTPTFASASDLVFRYNFREL